MVRSVTPLGCRCRGMDRLRDDGGSVERLRRVAHADSTRINRINYSDFGGNCSSADRRRRIDFTSHGADRGVSPRLSRLVTGPPPHCSTYTVQVGRVGVDRERVDHRTSDRIEEREPECGLFRIWCPIRVGSHEMPFVRRPGFGLIACGSSGGARRHSSKPRAARLEIAGYR